MLTGQILFLSFSLSLFLFVRNLTSRCELMSKHMGRWRAVKEWSRDSPEQEGVLVAAALSGA
jgi:hypothetical protein